MKHYKVIGAAAATIAFGLSACGTHDAEPVADSKDLAVTGLTTSIIGPYGYLEDCSNPAMPDDPKNLLIGNWPKFDVCSLMTVSEDETPLSYVKAKAVVYDARMKALTQKKALSELIVEGTQRISASPPAQRPALTYEYRTRIATAHAQLIQGVNDSMSAFLGLPPAGFQIDYLAR
ncbi:hypothetical protein PP568_17250 [Mycobacteroides abscessus]|uniref:Lipoprotein n=2 Tax=Mycobacteroides abscessus TaxID=36809 RepID=A0AB38CWK0_9MYCO|nr:MULTISPECIES: hypothetical protein [Mycobacteriaceae]MBE5420804.1 hypothetical protein [Mycobacteroides abscessus]MBN7434251.1 hypothetical protein [Mycobacteroides abscessus subsp. abscessus]MBN7462008.1 hypothetical protein [Mycobacteroides abscessus subsp. abscessus]MBN7557465.1 hypothetical protein [Mycobacteroides abscessus subsp. abscessus]MDM2406959.1 hypothetical protein [Mycobacteroides abscessus]